MRGGIYEQEMKELFFLSCEIEIDEAMFGGNVAGKSGWGRTPQEHTIRNVLSGSETPARRGGSNC